MTEGIEDRIRSVGRFEIVYLHCIDLYAILDRDSKRKMHDWRANGQVAGRLSEIFSYPEISAGTFYLTEQVVDTARSRMKYTVEHFEKSVASPMFYERALPFLFVEREGQKLSDTSEAVRLGRSFSLHEICSTDHICKVSYKDCELRLFRDGVLSVRLTFSGEDVPIEHFIELVLELKKLTRTAMLDKVRLIAQDFNRASHPFNGAGLRLIDPQELFEQSLTFRQFSSDHTLTLIESMKDGDGSHIPANELETQPGLLGILRQTQRAIGYKKQMLDVIGQYNQGYKSDEIYVTLRSTTLIVLPKHWNPSDYLSLYMNDLTLLIEYYVSKITYLDILALAIENTELLNEPIENIRVTRDLVSQIVSLRRILLLTEENLDVDLIVNHYFTRGVLLQLIEQRGIANKLDSIRKRINNMDRILDLIANSSFSQIGIGSGLLQVKIAIIALIATLLISVATLTLTLLQFKNSMGIAPPDAIAPTK